MAGKRNASGAAAAAELAARRRRLTLSDVVDRLLDRGPTDHSSVTLSRNAKGDTQVEVVVRTGDSGEVQTADQAAAKARELYDTLTAAYPREQAPAPEGGEGK